MFKPLDEHEASLVKPWRAPGLVVPTAVQGSGRVGGAGNGARIYHADQLVEEVIPAGLGQSTAGPERHEAIPGHAPACPGAHGNGRDNSAFEGSVVDENDRPSPASADAVQAAYDEGYAAGHQAGVQAGQQQALQQWQQSGQALRSAIEALSRTAELQEGAIEQDIYELARRLASQVLQREIEAEPELMLGVVRRALALLPSANAPDVWMHPEDVAIVVPMLAGAQAKCIRPDARMARGGCRVEQGAAQLDAGIEALLTAIDWQDRDAGRPEPSSDHPGPGVDEGFLDEQSDTPSR